MALLPEQIPSLLSARSVAAAATAKGILFDVSISGASFLTPVKPDSAVRRQSAPFKRDQIDTSSAPGEQTLSNFWTRSQDSWHLGAGAKFYEPGSGDNSSYPVKFNSKWRFLKSSGVDVWTPGQVTLLKKMVDPGTAQTGNVWVHSAVNGTTDCVVVAASTGNVKRIDADGTVTSMTASAFGAVEARVAIIGANVVYGNSFGLRKVPLAGGTDATLYTQALGTTVVPYYLKQRLIATRGPAVYELAQDGSSGTTPGDLSTVTAIYTHPDPAWTWTSFTETPGAIIGAGHSSGISGIYSWTLETNTAGSVPKLGQPFQVAEFPPGETVRAIRVYLGTYIGIGTSRGLRVGQVNDKGQMQYGPLLFQTASPVLSLAARDSFLYAGVTNEIDGKSGVARVDLGTPLDGLTFPYAWDANTGLTGDAMSVAFVGNTDRVVVGVKDAGVRVQSATVYETSGYIQSGQIRFATTEPKQFRSMDVRADTTGGDVGVSVVDSGGSVTSIVTLSAGSKGSNLSLSALPDRIAQAGYRLTLTAGTGTPVVSSVSVKALPSPDRQRMVQYPLLIADRQQDTRGNKFGADMYAWHSLSALERLEETSTTVPVQDFRTGEAFDAVIEGIDFVGTTPRDHNGYTNWSGIATVTLRKLA